MLPWPLARIAWAVLNLVFAASLTIVLRRLLLPQGGWRSTAFAVVTLFASALFLANLEIGQHAVFALGWFAAALWAERRGSASLAAVLLAASWFKYTMTLPLSLVFALRSPCFVLLAAAGMHIALTLFVALWMGSSPLTSWSVRLETV
jgi:hypothetical protein